MASMRFVLPCPLSPITTVSPAGKVDARLAVVAEVGQVQPAQVHRGSVRSTGQETRTGMSRYRNEAPSTPRSTAGFSASLVSSVTSSPGATSTPSSR